MLEENFKVILYINLLVYLLFDILLFDININIYIYKIIRKVSILNLVLGP
jgi:hypothetical protein